MGYEQVLDELGFTKDDDLAAYVQSSADDPNTDDGSMSANGAFQVLGAWRKGDLWVHLERNTAPEDQGEDMSAIVTHPPVFVVCKGDQRVAGVMQRDPEALKAVLSDLG